MARSLTSKTYLTNNSAATTWRSSSRLLGLRFQSNIPSNPPHTDSPDDTSSADPLLRKLEDAIHRIIVRRAAPDWLPFIPGSSYWVPPPRSTAGSLGGIAQLVEKLANPLTDEQSLSTTTIRGWPSSEFFLQGAAPHTIQVKMTSKKSETEATSNKSEVEATSDSASKSEDEEG